MPEIRSLVSRYCTFWIIAAWLVLPMLAGCNGGDEAANETDEQQEEPEDDDNSEPLSNDDRESEDDDGVADSGSRRPGNDDDELTQWIGDIPYDVYYDRPLEVAMNTQTIAANTTPGVTPDPMENAADPDPMESTASNPMTDAAPAVSGAIDWPSVIAIEVLDEEVKQIRNRLTANLSTVANFNREQESNQVDATVLSALAVIVTMHPGDLNWKEKAPYIRDLANVIYSNCTTTGREPHGICEVAFEQIQTMLDGGPVPTDLMADANRPSSEVADRYYLMYRFRTTSTHLKSNVNSGDRLNEDVTGVVRELSVLAALATLISNDSYEYAVESDYQGHIANFVQAVTTSRTGAELQSFEQFSEGMASIQKVCGECHQQYAFGTDTGI